MPPCAAPIGSRVRLDLAGPDGISPQVVLTDTRQDREWRVALSRMGDAWTGDLLLPQRPTIVTYHFELAGGATVRDRRQVEGSNPPVYGEWSDVEFRIAAFDPDAPAAGWARGMIVYQIFPDSFARSGTPHASPASVYGQPTLELAWGAPREDPPLGRDFYGGDLAGIEQRLPFLADLGVECLYLTPIFAAPTNHRYDTLDYFEIDPRLGTRDDLRSLLEAAAAKDIKVILDGVFNHCSSESLYLRQARADRTAPTYRWFDFTSWPDSYRGWLGVEHMPQFMESPEVEEFFFGSAGVARHWLRQGIAGWRLDVAPWKSDEFWRRFAAAARAERDDAYLVAEEWGDASRYLLGDTFDATMNYRFSHAALGFATGRLTPSELDDRLENLRRDTPAPRLHTQLNLLDSHDTPRLMTTCTGDKGRMKLAIALQFAYPGAPMVYYGSEAALRGTFAEDGRGAYPDVPDAELYEFYRAVIRARRDVIALRLGDVRTLHVDDGWLTYAFVREREGEQVVAAFNAGMLPTELALPLPGADGPWHDLLGGPAAQGRAGALRVRLPPLGAAYLMRKME